MGHSASGIIGRLGAAVFAAGLAAGPARAEDVIKIGLVIPLSGPFTTTGRQLEAGARLFMAQNGATIGGKRIELIVRDDTGVADVSKRLSQELIVRDGVSVLAGYGLTPLALAVAPLATQAKVPEVVMAAATSIITEQSPFVVRTSFTSAQAVVPLADWAAKEGIKRVATIVSDYGPGIDVEKYFSAEFKKQGGEVENLRVPLANPDFSPFLQRIADMKPDALLAFVPSGVGAQFIKQYVERGLDKSGIRFLAEGSVTDDDLLNSIGDVAIGAVTGHHYSAAHDSPENKTFVAAFKAANGGLRPNFMAVGAYDGMHVIYDALAKTNGAGGEALIAAMKGDSFVSPRGPISIDPETRDIVQNVYIRKVERKDGELYNVELVTVPQVKDPAKVR